MKFHRLHLIITLSLFSNFATAQGVIDKKCSDLSLNFETRAMDLVLQMTLEEKISQLAAATAIPRLNIQKYHWWNECLHGVAREV